MSKAIFPFSPEKVPDADWFDRNSDDMMKIFVKMTMIVPATVRKPDVTVIVLPTDSPKNGDGIL